MLPMHLNFAKTAQSLLKTQAMLKDVLRFNVRGADMRCLTYFGKCYAVSAMSTPFVL